jgi:HSP20 family molecular chaperone IbpA
MRVEEFAQKEEMREWARRIQDIMDEMRHRSFCDYRASGTWMPNINIYETRAGYHVCVEVAGLEPGSVTVECPDPRRLCLAGHRERPHLPRLEGLFSIELMEIDEGGFHREIDFSEPIEVEHVEVVQEVGYLWITLRKSASP